MNSITWDMKILSSNSEVVVAITTLAMDYIVKLLFTDQGLASDHEI